MTQKEIKRVFAHLKGTIKIVIMLVTRNHNTPTLKLLFEERPKVCPLAHVHSKNYKLIGVDRRHP
jgi:hypothetical protein